MGGGQSQTTVQKSDPWAEAQPYLKDIMGRGQEAYNSGAGSQLWGGPQLAARDWGTTAGIDEIARNAQQNSANSWVLRDALGQGGVSSAMQPGLNSLGGIGSGANGITTGGLYSALGGMSLGAGQQAKDIASGVAAQGPTASETYLTQMAAGTNGTNPFLQQMLDDQSSRIGNRVASQMSGMGRYGSGGHTDVLARSLQEAANPLLSQAYESDQNRRLSASGQIDAARQAAAGTNLNAANLLSGVDFNRLQSAMGAAQGLTGVQGQNIANQMGASNAQLGYLGQGLDRMAGLTDQTYDPGMRMMGLGAVNDQRAQQELDAQKLLFEQQQQMPWTQLGKYQNAVSGLGGIIGNAGSSTSTTSSGGGMGVGQGIGLGLSALGLLFSDERTKKDVVDVPAIDARTGAPMKLWRYAWEDESTPLRAGPMAQDVLKTRPNIVHNVGGLLAIEA